MFNGICLIDEETFEKAASTTLIAQTAAGAGMGALVAGEGNRMQGAALGAGVGLGGAMAGRALGRSSAMSKLTPQLQTKVTNQKAVLDSQLKNTKGLSARHDAIEAFMKNPNHAEFAGFGGGHHHDGKKEEPTPHVTRSRRPPRRRRRTPVVGSGGRLLEVIGRRRMCLRSGTGRSSGDMVG